MKTDGNSARDVATDTRSEADVDSARGKEAAEILRLRTRAQFAAENFRSAQSQAESCFEHWQETTRDLAKKLKEQADKGKRSREEANGSAASDAEEVSG